MLGSSCIVAFVATTNDQAAKNFYRDTLGLTLVAETPFALEFDAGGTHLRITTVKAVAAAPYTVLGWSVADVRETVRAIAGRGVAFECFAGMPQDELGIWTSPDGAKVAWFKDPDGNLLSVTQRA